MITQEIKFNYKENIKGTWNNTEKRKALLEYCIFQNNNNNSSNDK